MRILVVEDEKKVARALKEGLESEHFEVTVTGNGEEGFYLISEQAFDLIVLDLMLPGRDGLDILKTLRKRDIQTPVLVLTARDAIEDRVLGLDCGADDYLVKPFAFDELLARIRALFRRGRPEHILKLKLADLEIDVATRKVQRGGRALHLTAREYELLEYLLRYAGHTVSREMLARDVWSEPRRDPTTDNVIDVHIARLRRKVDDPFDRKLLKTVRGVGFTLSEGEP